MLTALKQLWKDEEGLTTVEYALLLALLVVAAIMALMTFGNQGKGTVTATAPGG